MPYLTFAEYNLYGFTALDESEFDRLLPKASDAVDSATRYFYEFNEITDDIEFRRRQFKKAIASQVEYFNEVGATTSHGLQEPGTVTIGRTSVSSGAKSSAGGSSAKKSILSDDALMYLRGTGLLYSGIGGA